MALQDDIFDIQASLAVHEPELLESFERIIDVLYYYEVRVDEQEKAIEALKKTVLIFIDTPDDLKQEQKRLTIK